MNYTITKQTSRNEWRIYLDQEKIDGKVIYQGHRLGIETKHLHEFLEFRQEKSSGKVLLLDYEKLKDEPDHKDMNMWIVGNNANIDTIVEKSWESLLNRLKKDNTNFRKIAITKVNI
jgi:tRNA U34 5-carboxymethylaminomethyl modifying enzyme MnmG/GidA